MDRSHSDWREMVKSEILNMEQLFTQPHLHWNLEPLAILWTSPTSSRSQVVVPAVLFCFLITDWSKAKQSEVAQLFLTLCDPMDCSLPCSSIHGIFQARVLERVAISFSNAWKWKVKVKSLSCFWLLATPWTAAYQAPPSMGFSRQSTGVGCHCLLQRGHACIHFVHLMKAKDSL